VLQDWEVDYVLVNGMASDDFNTVLSEIEVLAGLCRVCSFDDSFMGWNETHVQCSNRMRFVRGLTIVDHIRTAWRQGESFDLEDSRTAQGQVETGNSEEVREDDTSVRLGFSSGVCYHSSAEPGSAPRCLDE
jgi:hypothetical protein